MIEYHSQKRYFRIFGLQSMYKFEGNCMDIRIRAFRVFLGGPLRRYTFGLRFEVSHGFVAPMRQLPPRHSLPSDRAIPNHDDRQFRSPPIKTFLCPVWLSFATDDVWGSNFNFDDDQTFLGLC
jgi:hypothetical protein